MTKQSSAKKRVGGKVMEEQVLLELFQEVQDSEKTLNQIGIFGTTLMKVKDLLKTVCLL